MPLYSYRCIEETCNHEFEEKVPLAEFDSKETIPCEKCGKPAKRTITATRSASQSWKSWRT